MPAVLLAGFILAVYLNSLPGKLFWDDEVLILDNVFLRSFRHLPRIWITSVTAGGGEINNYYRPFAVTFYLLQFQFLGLEPFGYHAVSILLHIANAVLVLWWMDRRFRNRKLAFWAALLFALHPLQNETVNYISHQEGELACFFGLSMLLLDFHDRRWLSLPAWIFCLLSREDGVVFFLIQAADLLFRSEKPAEGFPGFLRRAKNLTPLWPHALILAAYIVLHVTAFNFLHLPLREYGAQAGDSGGLPLRLFTFAKVLLIYWKLLILPIGLHFDRDMTAVASLRDGWAWGAACADTAIIAALWRLGRSRPAARIGMLWFLAALLPYSGLLRFNNLIGEHFLYIPIAGIVLTAVALISAAGDRASANASLPADDAPPVSQAISLLPSSAAGKACCAVLLGFYGFQNVARNRDWRDPMRLYQSTLQGNPRSFRAANNFGVEYFRMGRIPEARASFLKALNANPFYSPALNNLGAVEESLRNHDLAMDLYHRAVAVNPGYALAHKNIARMEMDFGLYALAEREARLALETDPRYIDALSILGISLFYQKRYEEALHIFQTQVSIQPSPAAYNNLALIYGELGEWGKAQAIREKIQ